MKNQPAVAGSRLPLLRRAARRPGPAGGELPLLHRVSIAYLALPLAIWLLGWFRPWAGIPAAALLVAGLRHALSGSWRPAAPSRATLVVLGAALACVILTPAGGFFLHGFDWMVHRAVFLDLAQGGWPTYVADHPEAAPRLLRYYLGWYLPPALAARAAGATALDWAVPIWTWCGTALIAMLFARGMPTARAALLAVAVLFLFGGLDAADAVLLRAMDGFVHPPISNWYLEYQANFETFSTTPQHFIPAGIASLLLLQLRGCPRFLAVAGVVLVASLFWSTLLTLGLAPLAAAAALGRDRLRFLASWQNVLAAAPLAALAAIYLTSGETDFPRAWLWNLWGSSAGLAARLALLYATEFLVLAAAIWRLEPASGRDPFFLVVIAILLATPLYHYGSDVQSELSLRFPVPALVALAYYAARAIAARLPEAAQTRSTTRAHRPVAWWFLVALLAAGAVLPARSLRHLRPGLISYAATGESLGTDAEAPFFRQRTAERVPPLLAALLRDHEEPAGGDAELLIRSGYDVYLREPGRLIYRKPNCSWEEQARSWIFIDVRYAGAHGLAAAQAGRPPWDPWTARASEERRELLFLPVKRNRSRDEDTDCAMAAKVAMTGVESARTGQIGVDGRLMWEADVLPR